MEKKTQKQLQREIATVKEREEIDELARLFMEIAQDSDPIIILNAFTRASNAILVQRAHEIGLVQTFADMDKSLKQSKKQIGAMLDIMKQKAAKKGEIGAI